MWDESQTDLGTPLVDHVVECLAAPLASTVLLAVVAVGLES